MPIIERTPYECFNAFAEHLRGLVAATVTERYPLSTVPANERMILSFREEIPVAVPIETAAPTGWVTIEEVIRFLIVDLGMSPPCGDDWPNVVRESERKFYEDFTGKRYEAPSSP
jgi:hypothetical protein